MFIKEIKNILQPFRENSGYLLQNNERCAIMKPRRKLPAERGGLMKRIVSFFMLIFSQRKAMQQNQLVENLYLNAYNNIR